MERQLTLTTNSKKLLLKSAGLSSKDYINDVIALYGSRFGKKNETIEKNLFASLLKEENKKRQNRNDATEVKALIKKYEKPKVKKTLIARDRLVSINLGKLQCLKKDNKAENGNRTFEQSANVILLTSNKPTNYFINLIDGINKKLKKAYDKMYDLPLPKRISLKIKNHKQMTEDEKEIYDNMTEDERYDYIDVQIKKNVMEENEINNKLQLEYDNKVAIIRQPIDELFNELLKDEKIEELILKLLRNSGVDALYIKDYKITFTKIDKPTDILNNIIEEAGAMNLDGIIDNVVWCKNKKQCVPDWLTYKYQKTKGHIKSVKNYETIGYLSRRLLNDDESLFKKRPLVVQRTAKQEAVNDNYTYTLQNIIYFCQNTGKTLMALHDGKIIIHNHVKTCEDPLVIEIKNNHLYPITNKATIKSLCQIGSSSFKKKEFEKKEVEYESIKYITQHGAYYDYIIDTMKSLNTQVYNQKLRITNGNLHNFHIGKTLYSTNPYNEDVEKYCKLNDIKYEGQNPISFLPQFIKKLPQSFMNINIKNALFLEGIKHRTHYGMTGIKQSEKTHSLDINKQYRFIMENPMDYLMTVDFNTEIIEWGSQQVIKDGVFDFGLYFVETDDMTILHKSNWYSNNILSMAKENGIDFNVKSFIKGIKQDKNILKNIIDEIKDTFNKDITKQLINSISGYLGKTHNESVSLKVDNDINRVWEVIQKKNINEIFHYEKDGIHLYGNKIKTEIMNNNLPMYIQILDWANMLLAQKILSLGGYDNLVYRKTDAFIMNDVGIKPSCDEEMGGYKLNSYPIYQPLMNENRYVSYSYENFKWKTCDIKNSDDYQKVILHLAFNSLNISSRAGTGKSFIINKVAEQYKSVKLAFTNKAANNIQGKTIHSFLGIDDDNKCNLEWTIKALKGIEIIIIDEISMIDGKLWEILYQIKLMTGIRFLLCGDFRQLPPINDDTDYFNHQSVMYICNSFKCELEFFEKCRYDKVLYDFLEKIYNQEELTLKKSPFNLEGSHICYTNAKRKEINRLKNVSGELIKYEGIDNKYNEDIRINIGVPLMSLVSNKKLGFIKNELVYITNIKDDNIYIGEKFINKLDIHKYFMLGYALTIHKAQGDTIDGILNIHEINLLLTDKRLLYTAVSRGTTLKNIKFM